MDLTKYYGVIPAFYACYEEDGSISASRTEALARHLVDKGVKGLYVGGSSGECIYLDKQERKQTLEAVMKTVGGKCTIIAHVACNNTRDSMELAAHAQALGVDAIAAIPPIYFHLPDYAIASYWNDISSAAPDTDFIIYNIPQLAGVALTRSLLSLMRNNPRVIGVKNSSMPAYDIEGFQRESGEDFVVFNGPDEEFVSGRAIGAQSGIGGTYAVMPELFLKMDQRIQEGNLRQAQRIQHEVNAIIEEMCSCKGNLFAVMKKVLERQYGLALGGVRKPLFNLVPEDLPKVEAADARIKSAIARFA